MQLYWTVAESQRYTSADLIYNINLFIFYIYIYKRILSNKKKALNYVLACHLVVSEKIVTGEI